MTATDESRCGTYFGLSRCDRPEGHDGNHHAAVPSSYTPEQEADAMAHYDDQLAKSALTPPAIVVPTLVEWLTAQIDEDERVVLAATPGRWQVGDAGPAPSMDMDDWDVPVAVDGGYLSACSDCGVRGGHSAADAAHIVAWQPSRALAEIAAKRAILRLHTGDHECSVIDERGDIDNCHWVMDSENCTTLLLLARPIRGRDGWQTAWEVHL